ILLTATALTVSSGAIAAAQDIGEGATVFKQCAVCHKIGVGAANGTGPDLNGLDGRHSGSVPSYSYSDANKNSSIVWSKQTFADYIKDPRAKIPGRTRPHRKCSAKPPARRGLTCLFSYLVNRTVEDGFYLIGPPQLFM